MADVMNILEAEPSGDHREQLAVLVASGKVKEMTGIATRIFFRYFQIPRFCVLLPMGITQPTY